jgi:uncharacterized protein
MKMIRRSFLHGVLSLGVAPAVGSVVACASNKTTSKSPLSPLGELTSDPEGILELPPGYSYVLLETTGDKMSDGHPMGALPDGMACFEGASGEYILMRNHEVEVGESAEPEVAFNPNMGGGVSRVVIDAHTLERKSSNWVLVGTHRNCAGGPSPYGWLSCEESNEEGHGYVFVCDVAAKTAQKPQRSRSLGRFKHEAAAFDPKTEIIYLTEDERASAFYRHVPGKSPFEGKLQALKIVDHDHLRLTEGLSIGNSFEVDWVDIDDPEGADVTTSAQAFERGAAEINRGEGCWYFDGSVFFVSTEGGPRGLGQVFRLDVGGKQDRLTLIAQTEEGDEMINPDNLTVSPAGELFVVEDNDGPNHIRRIGPDGQVEIFARNVFKDGVSEICGVCFSPDNRVMFVNLQEPGLTLAIRGPFAGSAA